MTSRPTMRRITGLALVAVFGVAGCTFHPGSAAVVNGTAINQHEVDDLVAAACDFTQADRLKNHSSPTPTTSIPSLKHLFTQNLISFAIVDKAARQLHLTVSQAAIAKVTSAQPIPAGLSESAKSTLEQFFADSALTQLQQVVIGAHLKDSSVTSIGQVDEADYSTLLSGANPFVARFTRAQSVQVNPAYGSWNGRAVSATDGSLSAPTSAVAATWLRLQSQGAGNSGQVTGLPPNQVCG